MTISEVYIASSKEGKFRIDYKSNGKDFIEEFEAIKEKEILRTSYNTNGEILDQELIKGEITMLVDSFASKLSNKVLTKSYKEIKINKPCPSCKKGVLTKETKNTPIPVIPIYICNSCSAKSYMLTDAYLSKLVRENMQMFSDSEIKELRENHQKFINELKEYIIRIFTSKHITNIK